MSANILISCEIFFFLRKFLMFLHKNILICTPNYSVQHILMRKVKAYYNYNVTFSKNQSYTGFESYGMYPYP